MTQQHKILLTGCTGQVGWELQDTLTALGQVVPVGHEQMDMAAPDEIRRVVREIKPTLIVNAAAYTAVDKAESEPELAMAVNGVAPGILAEEAKRLDAALIHYSTDYVFDGRKHGAYVETDDTNPRSVYGNSKRAGELAIQAVGPRHLIFRTSWVYGLRGHNFLLTILRLAQERDVLRVVNDQIGAPTWSRSIAAATAQVLEGWRGESGLYHLTCGGQTSWHGFAQAILREYQLLREERGWPPLKVVSEGIEAIATEQYPLPATRPANSVLDNTKLFADFGVKMPEWQDGLVEALRGADKLG